jgi:nucleoid-associated protein YgaU
VAPDGSAVIAGRSAPGAHIAITDNGKTIGHTTADAQGQWVFLPDAPLPAGGQELAAIATRPDGHAPDGQTSAGSAPVLLLVPPAASAPGSSAPAANGPPPSTNPPPAAVAVLAPPGAAPRLLSSPPGKSALGMDIVDYDDHGRIRFAGTAPPGTTIRVYVDGALAGDAAADAKGRWSLHPAAPISPGNHKLRLDQLAHNGQVAARLELPFQRAELAEQDVAVGRIVVQPSQNLWRIARHAYGHGIDYMTIYQANRDQIRDPNLIYPGQVFAMPAAAPSPAPIPASSSTSR